MKRSLAKGVVCLAVWSFVLNSAELPQAAPQPSSEIVRAAMAHSTTVLASKLDSLTPALKSACTSPKCQATFEALRAATKRWNKVLTTSAPSSEEEVAMRAEIVSSGQVALAALFAENPNLESEATRIQEEMHCGSASVQGLQPAALLRRSPMQPLAFADCNNQCLNASSSAYAGCNSAWDSMMGQAPGSAIYPGVCAAGYWAPWAAYACAAAAAAYALCMLNAATVYSGCYQACSGVVPPPIN
jgi:hypothetical protein